jgi:imidazolonepropionase-like amidohydrolase
MKGVTTAVVIALLAGGVLSGGPGSSAAGRSTEILVKGATIWTVAKRGTIEKGDLLVRDGRIVSVGAGLSAPAGALVIDAAGKHVTPGLIDAHSHTAIDGGVNEGSNNVTAEVRIADVLDPDDISIYRELAGGLTAANLLHGSANSIGGQNQVIKLKWGATADQLKFPGAPDGIKFALGENPKRSNFGGSPFGQQESRYPATRMGVEQSIRERFIAARQYRKDWDEYNAMKPKDQERRVPPRRDLQLDALVEILEGKRLVHSHCYRQDEILMLIRVAEEFGFKIATFQHVLEGYKVADEIARHGAGASTFSDWWAYKLEAYDAIPFNGALMAARGVVVSFNSDSDELARRLNSEAAKAMKYGDMPEAEAIKLVTINPAKQLRIDSRVGSLEAGKDADFVIWSGHPLSAYTIAEQTWVDGVKQFDRTQDAARRLEIDKRRAELIEKVKAGDKPKKDEKAPDKPVEAKPAAPPATASTPAAPATAPAPAQPARPTPPARPASYEDRLASLSGTLAIVGATVHTVAGPDVAAGTVIIKAGRIEAVGAAVPVPAGATIVDGKGLHLYPGMIDADTVVGLTEIGSVAGSVDTNETGKINPNVRAEVAINPESELIPVTRANGITHVLTAPAGGIISGTSALIRLDGWTWEDMRAAAPVAMHVSYPAYPRTGGFGFFFGPQLSEEEQKKRREGDIKELKSAIEAARAYQRTKEAGRDSFKPDPVLEAMLPLIEGRIPVIVEASEIRQIREAVAWVKQEGLRMILAGGGDAWRAADLLRKEDIAVIVGPIFSNSFRPDEPYDTAYTTPLKLHEAGVRFCISNGGGGFAAANTRNLPWQAAMAAAFGLPKDAALKAVTLYPAQILGVGDRLGSIEAGKSASLILTDGDPLEIRTKVVKEFIDGRPVDLGNRHQHLYDKYRSRPVIAAGGGR